MQIGETFELPAGAGPTNALGGAAPSALAKPRPGDAERNGRRGDGGPGALAVEGEDPDPGAHDAAVKAGEIVGGQAAGGDQVGETKFRKIGDLATGVKGREDEVVIATGSEAGAGAVEGVAARVGGDGVGVGEGGRTANREAGADGGEVGPRSGRTTVGNFWRRAEIAQSEESVELTRPGRGRCFPLRDDGAASGRERRRGGEALRDGGEVGGSEDVVVVDEDEDFAARSAKAGQSRGREAGGRLDEEAGVQGGEKWLGGGREWGRTGVVDDEEFPLSARERLGGEAGEGAAEAGGVRVARGDDDRDHAWGDFSAAKFARAWADCS